ncbi:unnamed protein product [Anisakis simplex]|uniref:Galaxin-like repeats domain-containing protein n=1 Tax=Anisakis simplex TaxID=6269 RepID=A0A3P6PY08_ANISI|nr:unnamed protein product [Anisakis simplex]
MCCNGVLIRTESSANVCCGNNSYDGGVKETCCHNTVFKKSLYDSCCQSNDGTFTPFSSKTHICCDKPIARTNYLSCCYLKLNDRLRPTPYDSMSQCCKYPFKKIIPMQNSSCIV